MRPGNTGFHSVGSRSDLASCTSLGIRIAGMGRLGTLVGVMGATMGRGERGGEVGGVVFMADMEDMDGREAERGLRESLLRQLYPKCESRVL